MKILPLLEHSVYSPAVCAERGCVNTQKNAGSRIFPRSAHKTKNNVMLCYECTTLPVPKIQTETNHERVPIASSDLSLLEAASTCTFACKFYYYVIERT